MSEERKYGRRASDGPAVDLSIVVPMLNEEEGLDLLFERLEPILESITEAYEIVCVDDGSTDGTMASLVQHRVRNPRIKVLSLSRNFGKDVALSAGLNHACGQAVVPMDSDLQDPPELIPQMWEKKAEGYDVVLARRAGRESDGWLKRITAQAFYRVHNRMAEIAIPDDTGDFRMMDRKVIEVLRHLPERTRFMKGLFAWVGFSHCEITYEREARAAGTTKWRYWKLWNFALDGITASSSLPLRMWTYLGGALATFAIGFALWTAVRVMIWGVDVPGYASLMTAILFLGGINIFATGILGEYLGRVYTEVRNRPLYVVREEHGLTSSEQDTWNDRSSTVSKPLRANTGGLPRAAAS